MTNDESHAEEHLTLAMGLFASTTVTAVFYTLTFILYCLSFRLLYAQLRNDQGKIVRRTVWKMVFQTVLLTCATVDIILSGRDIQVRFIDHGALPGGPFDISATMDLATIGIISFTVNVVENFLISGVLVWRVWVIWSGTRFATALTIVSLFLYIVDNGLGITYYATPTDPDSLAERILFIMSTASGLAGSVFMTSVIILRLLSIRQAHIKVMGKSDIAGQYLGIAAMLIESYMLDAVWGIGGFISYDLNYDPTTSFFDICVTQVDVLTIFLLAYRVHSGRAWTRQTQDRLSTLRWTSSGVGTTNSGAVGLGQVNIPEEDPPVVCSRNDV